MRKLMTAQSNPTQADEAKALVWETFPDPSYFDMHAVRTVGAAFTETMHLPNADEAKWLVNHLNSIHTQLAERDAQLAATHKMMTRLAEIVEYVSGNEYAMAECHDDWREAINDTLYSYQKRQATRQPTQITKS
ncbi:hypothetical protein UFOVP315_24 [uncultured Caudovirales phage]|uniref:Uncharacterized protein n=1 Tax=uncultured Caudovirales phage TaxID=2100421 RepID=A0A6J5LYW8_9CAUD|nr:hypothetical protein UFOVP315_24 [uncultured Caudovirales phage]